MREPVVIAGTRKVGGENIRGAGVNERCAVFSGEVVIGIPASPIEQGDGDAAGIGIIAGDRGAAAVEVSRGEFVEIAAELAEFVIINKRENQGFGGRTARPEIIWSVDCVSAEHRDGLCKTMIGSVRKNGAAGSTGELVRIGGTPGPTRV